MKKTGGEKSRGTVPLRAALLLELLAIYSEYVYWSVTVIPLSLFFFSVVR
jgi:hypothetical protein